MVAVGSVNLTAQDFHFTQFEMAPLTLNPSLTGAYEGTFRVGGIYRDQWASVLGDDRFRTPSFYVDAPIIKGFRKSDWVGVGVSFLNDQVGSFNYQNTWAGAALSYHLGFGKTTLSIGGQVNQVQRRVDASALQMGDNFDFTTGDFLGVSSDATALSENVSFMDVAAGVNLSTPLGEKARLNVGASAAHINGPTDGFQGDQPLDPRISLHGRADIDLTSKWLLTPSVLYQTISGAQEVNAIAMIGYRVADNFLIQYGQGWRVGDATNSILAIEFNRLRVGVSYDINISDLNVMSNNDGGFELAASYIARITNAPKSKPVIFCPRF